MQKTTVILIASFTAAASAAPPPPPVARPHNHVSRLNALISSPGFSLEEDGSIAATKAKWGNPPDGVIMRYQRTTRGGVDQYVVARAGGAISELTYTDAKYGLNNAFSASVGPDQGIAFATRCLPKHPLCVSASPALCAQLQEAYDGRPFTQIAADALDCEKKPGQLKAMYKASTPALEEARRLEKQRMVAMLETLPMGSKASEGARGSLIVPPPEGKVGEPGLAAVYETATLCEELGFGAATGEGGGGKGAAAPKHGAPPSR